MTDTIDISAAHRSWAVLRNGAPMPASATYPIEDPSTGNKLTEVPDCSDAEVDELVRAAIVAQREWGALPPRQRAAKVREFGQVLREHREELALLDAIDAGFPLHMMRIDVDAAVELLDLFCDAALELGGRTIPVSNNLHFTTQQPYGVVARIGAFNHPFFFSASKVAAPLVAGNAVILKAPDQAPLSALRMAELAATVLPPNLCITISGRGSGAGRALVRHPEVRRIGFIGSPETGRLIQQEAAAVAVKNISLELGGKNAMIVMPDADLSRAAQAAVTGMNFTWTAGQSCGSTSRLLVHESIADELTAAVADIVAGIVVGHPLDPAAQMGPLISQMQYEKSLDAIASGVSSGAHIVAGGSRPTTIGDGGWFLSPTVLADVPWDSDVATNEIFGPVLSIITFRDEDEAITIANSVEYGLTGAIWTTDITRAHRMAQAIDAGYVLINGASRHYWGLPFGGVKSSGVGREESVEELISYSETKATTVVLS
ncbi:aldehyde dehydrogenase family protein [Rhodococcus opacus]|uniref:Aldehyde dehydrogenase n=2 Tax=Rhodococcus TaxID=1827 RepID=A0A076EYD5_RHOOP|nr:aldehyde dehydrogenase family protein [Rhodococcus opacus]AAY57933.1 PhdK [Rhodococcus sp. TFB]AII10980.1 aldehyde dehydrogenase [Rhodococcus opacus]